MRALTDDLASRRVNLASPNDSLMLLKAVAEVPHEGGRRTTVDSRYYQTLRQWIASGATLDRKSPRVVKIEILPQDPVVQKIGSRQQFRVVASYGDGLAREVTAEASVESGNTDVATADASGLITTLRRGEAPVLARYEGNYAATTLTVMGDRTGFVWVDPQAWGKLDELVAAKWKRLRIAPSELCTDLEFIRRVYLDLTGLPPSPEEIRAFLDDSREVRIRRDGVVDHLIGSSEYVDFWANKWADLLQCNSQFLGSEGAELFRAWIRSQVEKNTPCDQFAREILTASGSTRENPAASYWKILRAPGEAMENTTHLFLATRFNCNKWHDHPFERWTQDQYYHLAAYFAQVSLQEDPASEGRRTGGNEVESAKPLYETVADATEGEVKHDRTGQVSPPAFPYPAWHEADKINYSHALARRLPAETLFDAVMRVTGSTPHIPGAKPGQRAVQLADAATDVGSGLLATLGRPARQSACECERTSDIGLGSVMALLSGPTISGAINDPTNGVIEHHRGHARDLARRFPSPLWPGPVRRR